MSFPGILRDAWLLWRRDWRLLTAIAGLFLLLPSLSNQVLIANFPTIPANVDPSKDTAAMLQFQKAISVWLAQYGMGVIVANLLVLFGQLALVALYLGGQNPTVAEALKLALRRYPMLLVSGIIGGLPVLLFGMVAAALPITTPIVLIITIIVMARLFQISTVLIAERPIGPLKAVLRSLSLTRGHTITIASVVLTMLLFTALASYPFAIGDNWLRANAPNPLARVLVGVFIAAIYAFAGIATSLAQVATWRQLNSR
jgi:hypothetical protein